MWELASAVSGRVVWTDHLKELLENSGDGRNLGGQVETWPIDGAKMKALGANDLAFEYLEIDKLDADAPGVDR